MFPLLTALTALFVLSTALEIPHRNATTLNLAEGEVCRTRGDRKWTCRTQEECPHLRGEAADVCSFRGKETVVCCPQLRRTRGLPLRRSAAQCLKYTAECQNEVSAQEVFGTERNQTTSLRPAPPYRRNFITTNFPHLALVGFGRHKTWLCAGSLVSERWVLTAAHCAGHNKMGRAKWVRLGEEDTRVAEARVHPEFRGRGSSDLALLRLERPATLSKGVRPVCLGSAPLRPLSTARSPAWRRTPSLGGVSPHMEEVGLRLYEDEKCESALESAPRLAEGFRADSMICAAEESADPDLCSGDTGGPVVQREPGKCLWEQVGVIVLGRQCGAAGLPLPFTRVKHFLPWIESVVWPTA